MGTDKCTWAEDDEGVYETSCGGLFSLTSGTPGENHFKFCPYCGGNLVVSNEAQIDE